MLELLRITESVANFGAVDGIKLALFDCADGIVVDVFKMDNPIGVGIFSDRVDGCEKVLFSVFWFFAAGTNFVATFVLPIVDLSDSLNMTDTG